MKDSPFQIIVQINTDEIAAQITEQISEKVNPIGKTPHYVTKYQAINDLGWSEYHLKQGEIGGFLKPLRLSGKGEIRFSFSELSVYHNHLQCNGNGSVQVYNTKNTGSKGKDARPRSS